MAVRYPVRMKRNRRRGFTLVELMLVVGIIGILTSFAIPNFQKFQIRARQGEAKSNLRTWLTCEKSTFQDKGLYSEQLSETGYVLERGNRFQYVFSPACTYEVRAAALVPAVLTANCITVDQFKFPTSALAPPPMPIPVAFAGLGADPGVPGIGGLCPSCNITGMAAGNLDNDLAGTETWFISTKEGTVAPGMCSSDETAIVSGIPYQMYDDSRCP